MSGHRSLHRENSYQKVTFEINTNFADLSPEPALLLFNHPSKEVNIKFKFNQRNPECRKENVQFSRFFHALRQFNYTGSK